MTANVRRLAGLLVAALLVTMAILTQTSTRVEAAAAVRVMPLGDSITDGYNVPGGYRIDLWQKVNAGGYTVDFVGSQSNGPASLGDQDHEGHSGWRIDQIDANIVNWLRSSNPRTVLLHIGTNDMTQNRDLPNAPNRLAALVDRITNTAPGPRSSWPPSSRRKLGHQHQDTELQRGHPADRQQPRERRPAGLPGRHVCGAHHRRPRRRHSPECDRLQQDGHDLVQRAPGRTGQPDRGRHHTAAHHGPAHHASADHASADDAPAHDAPAARRLRRPHRRRVAPGAPPRCRSTPGTAASSPRYG